MAEQNNRTTKLRADIIRKRLSSRHDEGTAVREQLDKLTDQQLIALDDRETAAKIACLRAKKENL
jgi:hypothetical protein